MTIRAIVIDDERILAEDIAGRVHARSGWSALAFTDSHAAWDELTRAAPDVCFLDVEMPEESGLDFALRVTDEFPSMPIVFITAFQQYAVQAFRLHAVDYLVKPVSDQLLNEACTRIEQGASVTGRSGGRGANRLSGRRIAVKSLKRLTYVDVESILAGKSEGNYLELITEQGRFLPRTKIDDFLEPLSGSGFVRTHRSWFVNPAKVLAARLSGDRIRRLELVGRVVVPVSERHADAVERALAETLLRGRY